MLKKLKTGFGILFMNFVIRPKTEKPLACIVQKITHSGFAFNNLPITLLQTANHLIKSSGQNADLIHGRIFNQADFFSLFNQSGFNHPLCKIC